MAIDKHDRKTIAIEGITKTPGRPKGSSEPLTPAQKMKAYRARKAKKGFKTVELSRAEIKEMLLAIRLQIIKKPGITELEAAERKLARMEEEFKEAEMMNSA